jgi:putative ABC transport system permease protein
VVVSLSFALGYAARSLRRESQRTMLAVLCIAFGVLALVAMQLLSVSMSTAFAVPPVLSLGGDAEISPRSGAFTAAERAVIDDLTRQGVITHAARISPSRANLVRRETK